MDDISEEEGGATGKGGWDRSCAILHCYCKLAYIVELFFSKLSNKLSITCAWGWGGDYWILIFLVNSPPPFFSRELLAPGSRSLELFILHPFFI